MIAPPPPPKKSIDGGDTSFLANVFNQYYNYRNFNILNFGGIYPPKKTQIGPD